MTGVVVAYTATDAGADALALGARLAAATGGILDLVLVLPAEDRSVITPPAASYDRHLRLTAQDWLREAAEMVPDAVTTRAHVRHAESSAEGLVAAASEFEAGLIVVGAGAEGARGRHRVGTVASELMHFSDVPVVLAPAGSREMAMTDRIPRITVAIGTRPGGDVLIEEAVALAAAAHAPLRLVSLATVDMPRGADTGIIRLTGAVHADAVLAQARAALPAGIEAEAVIGHGADIEEAVRALEWEPAEIVMVGSSRLAQPRRLFLGSTASKMLHVLPVPMIVVPRTRGVEGAQR
jgi:nucleotide-binding universal stress UspA family protein